MTYVDGFVLPVPKKQIEPYLKMARAAAKVFREHGALQHVECVADDVKVGKYTSFPQSVKLKPDETVVFSWILLQVARASRQGQRQGDERPAHREDDEGQEDALRRQAHDLLAGSRRRWICRTSTSLVPLVRCAARAARPEAGEGAVAVDGRQQCCGAPHRFFAGVRPLPRGEGEVSPRLSPTPGRGEGKVVSISARLFFAQDLRIDVDHQCGEEDEAADQDFEEAVDLDVVEAVVQDAKYQEPIIVLPMPPRPPNRLVPPTTTAAIASSRKVSNWFCCAEPK